MTSNQDLAIYYKKTKTCYTEFLKEFFSKKSQSKNLRHRIKNNENILQQELPIDEIFLIEALTFLRLSIFNFLAYKDLMCGNYLAWSKVTWYYSIFYAINGMLRLDGKAIIHVDGISFQLIRDGKFHSYKMTKSKGNEHKKYGKFSQRHSQIHQIQVFPDLLEAREYLGTMTFFSCRKP